MRYEDVRLNTMKEMQRVILELSHSGISEEDLKPIIDRYSFQKMSGRAPGEENKNSFLRKGIVGDWRNYFSIEARKRFHGYAGEPLIELGYEKDDSWVNSTQQEG